MAWGSCSSAPTAGTKYCLLIIFYYYLSVF
jgi:hypothetical protein